MVTLYIKLVKSLLRHQSTLRVVGSSSSSWVVKHQLMPLLVGIEAVWKTGFQKEGLKSCMDDAILPMRLVWHHLEHGASSCVVPLLDTVQLLALCSVFSGQNAGWLVCFKVLEDTRPNFFCLKFQGYSSNGLLPLPQMMYID
jgi:hypothetical protein